MGYHREISTHTCGNHDTEKSECFEEGKTELGMAHYEVRKYAGWQHHMLLTMLAHFFLWHLKGRLGEKSASADRVAAPPVLRSRVAFAYLYD